MDKRVIHAWTHTHEDIFSLLETSPDGLTEKTASQRLRSFGTNNIKKRHSANALKILMRQAINPLVALLYAAFIFSVLLGKTTEAVFIGAAIVVNIALGFFQEYKANNAMRKLESYIKHTARVKRNGTILTIDTKHIVPGDIILLKQGDQVSADIRLIETHSLEADEAIITGESLAIQKQHTPLPVHTVLADMKNMVWAGSTITQGEGWGVVVSTGMRTEIGKIAELVHGGHDDKTPLEQEVAKLAKLISIFLVALGIAIFGIGLYSGFPLEEILLLSVAVIVSAVPGSIPVALSVVLAVGAESLARKKGVVRKMSATETLGSTTLILTDKTGTLTEAVLKLTDIDVLEETQKSEILVQAALNVDITENKETGEISGRPVEIALTKALHKDAEAQTIAETYNIIDTFPFSSTYKFSAIFFTKENKTFVTLLGAPDILLEKTPYNSEEKTSVASRIDTYAHNGERILGVVTKEISTSYDQEKELQTNNFTYTGLIRFRDPIRASVPSAARNIMNAGVRVIMVTGDHPGTAQTIAKEVGIWQTDSVLLTGSDMDNMTNAELIPKLPHTQVFARMTPKQKLRLVELFTSQGEVVAVTGDGVNDAPALKRAAIGIAMGSGTDVARASADIVILDNNFATITHAIFEGRNILQKMRSVITYLLADSYDELLLIGGSILVSIPLPLTALQILFVKFFSDIFPAMGFTFEKTGSFGNAKNPPVTSLFDRKIKILTLGRGLISSLILFSIYFFMLRSGLDGHLTRTFIFASFASYILFLAFSMRNLEQSILTYNPFANRYLTLGVIVGFLTITAAIYVPYLSNLLDTEPLPALWFIGVIGIGLLNLLIMEILKKLVR